ncbi:molecular chaperone [Providencia alcalifaciens]|uniref:fimbrial biogenesis chaperone n=1 Tax=Providencia alcalifaciens TaxID=126385 RepID=UPI0004486C7C|nr:fimbria/pilus periplasmic chaperone [Providencia alcalifaciens]EUD08999.1 PapD pilus/flagellar-assembly chaperone N-terminal domain protein [Providencia alcalifaciens R90-1475]
MYLFRKFAQKAILVTLCTYSVLSYSAVSLDRTRAVFNGSDKSMTMNISNDNTQLPYLAQAWLENSKQEKITAGPLVITPPVQRLEPGAKSMVRISTTPDISKLPQDRESLFYFSLREIPPKSEKPNVLQIALQTKIKLFYRPKAIEAKPDDVWQKELILTKINGGYRIENPTPYYITIIGLAGSEKESKQGKFESIMVSPKSSEEIKSPSFSTPWVTYINDYGGRPSILFKCDSSRCVVDKK